MEKAPKAAVTVVLDTNVVLDWLAFADPACAALDAAHAAGRWRWLATAAMREELAEVLTRESFGRHRPDATGVLAAWEARVTLADPAPDQPGWRCADPADQPFLDLALHARAAALLTRDKALLAFAARAEAIGLIIVPPAAWTPPG